jgi:hypothetical protein
MRIFDELEAQYYDIDDRYSLVEFEAANKSWSKKEQKLKRMRELNDQAYFLFMFSRLEDRIRQESSSLIIKKKGVISSWKQRAAWDILPSGTDGQPTFKNRLALLTDKSANDYRIVCAYYNERNSIAHGGSFTSSISMPIVVPEFKRLYRLLKA